MANSLPPTPNFWVSLSICIFAFLISLIVAVKKLDIVKPLRIFGLGLFLSDVILLIPLFLDEIAQKNYGIDNLGKTAAFFSAIMNAAQMVTLDADFPALFTDVSGSFLGGTVFLGILCFLTPVVCGGIALTFFDGIAGKFVYRLFRTYVPVYFFSELSENSLYLAKSVQDQRNGRCLCVFCGISESISSELKESAKISRFLLFRKNEANYLNSPDYEQIYFELSENQDENLSHTRDLIDSYIKRFGEVDYSAIKIFLFSEQEEAPLLLREMDKKGMPVVIVNRHRLVVNNLLFTYPLYNVLSDNAKTMSVLIVGAGKVGRELLRTCLWCGQLGSEYQLKITVIDKNASVIKRSMQLECPEFFTGEYNISFLEVDATTADFQICLDENCAAANYICVCLDNDEMNIRTALYMRSYYQRKDVLNAETPFISAFVKNSIKNMHVSDIGCHIKAFGGNNLIYSYALIDSELEKLALNVQQIYEKTGTDKNKILQDYYKDEYGIKSNRANAIHIRYKLFSLGYDMHIASDEELRKKNNDFSLLEDDVQRLARIEHDRWNAYTRGEGWCRASLEQIEKTKNSASKIPNAKLHACLCSWDELDEVSKYLHTDYKKYDEDFVRNIPQILGLESSKQNISGVRYVLVKRK